MQSLREIAPSTTAPAAKSSSDGRHDRRKGVQAALRRYDRGDVIDLNYLTLFESSTDALSLLDPDGVILEANPRWQELLQLPREQIVGRHIRDLSATGHEQSNEATYREAVKQRQSGARIIPIARADGKTIHVEISTINVAVAGNEVVFAIGRDVTQLVETVRELERSEQRYRSLVENIPDVVWSLDRDGRAEFVSAKIESVIGYTARETIEGHNRSRWDGCHPDDLPKLRAAYETMVYACEPADIEYRRKHKNGSWVWLHMRGRPSLDDSGQLLRIEGVITDITKRRKLEEQLSRAQKLEAIGQLTGGVAHDFNNILSVILANTHFLLDALPASEASRDDVEEIKRAAERAATLTRQLLAFSRQQVLATADVDVNDIVSGMHKMLRRVISEDIALSIEPSAQRAMVHADSGQLEQVIMNVCVNARDAMPGGGTLCIATERVHIAPPNADGVPRPGDYVRLSIRDTGTGMDEATKRQIFEPFFTTKGPARGTGLGLSTCYGIVVQSDGFIDVETAVGRGTTIHVYLPYVQHAPASVRAPRVAQATRRGDETVLLVEDDELLRKALQRALSAAGYTVLCAGTVADAMGLFAEVRNRLDLVLSDVVLPDQSGIALMDRVHDDAPSVKTMLMSGHTDHALLERHTFRVGTTFLQKPFHLSTLTERVRETLDA